PDEPLIGYVRGQIIFGTADQFSGSSLTYTVFICSSTFCDLMHPAHEKVLEQEHPSAATFLNNLALLYKIQGHVQQGGAVVQTSCNKVLGSEHSDTATSLNKLVEFYRSQGNCDKAETLNQNMYDKSESLYQKGFEIGAPNHGISSKENGFGQPKPRNP
ncbi:hypothetical protein BC938DRAFT_477618, partial [Jimgerdemannia flammicorona]